MKTSVLTAALCVGLSLSSMSLAATCPTHLTQDTEGYWISSDAPGWKSIKPTKMRVTLEAKNFGGGVYSPVSKRVGCVYKASDGTWVALLSNTAHPFNEDDFKTSAWKYIEKFKDYICGKPEHDLNDCEFNVRK